MSLEDGEVTEEALPGGDSFVHRCTINGTLILIASN